MFKNQAKKDNQRGPGSNPGDSADKSWTHYHITQSIPRRKIDQEERHVPKTDQSKQRM